MNELLTHQLNEISFHKIEFYLFYNRCNNVNRFFESRYNVEQRYRDEHKIYQIVEFFNLVCYDVFRKINVLSVKSIILTIFEKTLLND